MFIFIDGNIKWQTWECWPVIIISCILIFCKGIIRNLTSASLIFYLHSGTRVTWTLSVQHAASCVKWTLCHLVVNLLPVCLNFHLKCHQCLKIHSYTLFQFQWQSMCERVASVSVWEHCKFMYTVILLLLHWVTCPMLIRNEAIGVIQKHIYVPYGLNILLLYIILWLKRNWNILIYYACNWTWNCNVGPRYNIFVYKANGWYFQI